MKTTMLLVALALACGVASASAGQYTWKATPGVLSVASLSMVTENNAPYAPGVFTTVTFNGVDNRTITTGTFKYQIYETGMPRFTQSGSYPYYKCTNKGCNMAEPLSLTLANPTAIPTNYDAKITLSMPRKYATGEFTLLIWGTDQTHGQDVSVQIMFGYSSSVAKELAA